MPTHFDIDPLKTRTNLVIEMDGESYAQLRDDERANRVVRALSRARVVGVDEADQQDMAAITVRPQSLNRFGPGGHSEAHDVIVELCNTAHRIGGGDERISELYMSTTPVDNPLNTMGRRVMWLSMAWPTVDEREAAQFATTHMQRVAAGVNYLGLSRRTIGTDVGVGANRSETGVLVTGMPMAGISIESDHADYSAEPVVRLSSHNIYSPEQQLLLLVGAVGFAAADKHLR